MRTSIVFPYSRKSSRPKSSFAVFNVWVLDILEAGSEVGKDEYFSTGGNGSVPPPLPPPTLDFFFTSPICIVERVCGIWRRKAIVMPVSTLLSFLKAGNSQARWNRRW